MSAASLDRRLLEHARSAGLFPERGLALLAVSGGPDSLALLDLMHRLAPELGLGLAVGHVDHGILPDSAGVAQQVAAAAAGYGLDLEIARLDLGPRTGETRARRARYAALRAMQHRLGAKYLVTAHHADDQIETVLYRVLRGSGVAGLSGIAAQGPEGLVRPLLPFRRAELAEWLAQGAAGAASRVAVHFDPTNSDPRHDRAWIRSRLLPLLRQRFGERLDQAILDLAEHAARERRAWSDLLKDLPQLECAPREDGVECTLAPLIGMPPALAESLLGALAREAGLVLGPSRCQRLRAFLLRARSGQQMPLSQGSWATVGFGRLHLHRQARGSPPGPVSWGGEPEGRLLWGAWEVSWKPEAAGPVTRGGWVTWVEPGRGLVRARSPGDRLVPFGGVGRRTVRRLLMEARVPRCERDAYPLLVRETGILWVPGVCRSASAVPAPGTPALRLEVHRRGTVGAGEVVG
jgi:tRNA(Ile)-lysidine synthase